MSPAYDFIVVGAGPSGCVTASRLANSPAKPSVLLLEAGSSNKGVEYTIPADRYNLAFTQPTMNWGYQTEPQTHLKGQQIDYSRGKGLGGSTAINFCCWVIGADEDFEEFARLVGDDAWAWRNVKERFKKIETYHIEIPKEHQQYIGPKATDHGINGPLHLSYAEVWEKNIADVFVAAEEVGLGTNPDINSGNPIGMGLGASTMYKGARTTASAYLQNAPSNLTIITAAPVAKVLISGKTARGVITTDGTEFKATKEVILSGGAINSPQILMLSGIGPADELKEHGISIVHDLPHVGKNLQDHCFSTATILQKEGTNDRMAYETDEKAKAAAKEQFEKDGTGLLAQLYCGTPMAWLKNENILNSPEFAALPESVQNHIRKPTVPTLELVTNTPPLFTGGYELQPKDSYLTALSMVMNPQSVGEITLRSSNPSDPPKIDPKLLSHPFDRRVAIEGMRQTMKFLNAPVFKKTTVKLIGCPKSQSDEDIWDHISGDLFSTWHMCRTVKMGKVDDKEACVDTNFKVFGVNKLRVVDLSILPLVPNNHTQSTAYLVGETAAEKIIAEYGLDVGSYAARLE